MVILGEVNYRGELTVSIGIRDSVGDLHEFPAFIDTGFTDYLTLPSVVIDALSLKPTDERTVVLGDGTEISLGEYDLTVSWLGQDLPIKALQADGMPLIGLRLLHGCYVTHHAIDGGPVMIYRP